MQINQVKRLSKKVQLKLQKYEELHSQLGIKRTELENSQSAEQYQLLIDKLLSDLDTLEIEDLEESKLRISKLEEDSSEAQVDLSNLINRVRDKEALSSFVFSL